jgi:hypothetical protein
MSYYEIDVPKLELCYEIFTHKKVYDANIIMAIPEGKKELAWFTKYKDNNVCFMLECIEGKIKISKKINTSFTTKLALGTIFYGTSFTHNHFSYFCVEDIYYYLGKPFFGSYLSKLELLKDIFKNEISQNALDNHFTIFGLPLFTDNFQIMLDEIPKLPYNVSYIKFRFFDNKNAKKIITMKYFKPSVNKEKIKLTNNKENETNNKEKIKLTNNDYNNKTNNNYKKIAIFKIMADIDPDIYHLYMTKNGIEEYVDIAFIPDYKTSVMMNKLFRNIKENENLDAIEESDNEEEFENCREDKYVYLDRSFEMHCEYNYKFKRWVPIRLQN